MSKESVKMNLNNLNHQLVVAGLTGMVEDDGLSPSEAFRVLEDIKMQTFHALMQIGNEGDVSND